MIYKKLKQEEIELSLFQGFCRHQVVTQCWRKELGKWQLKDEPFIDDWTKEQYMFLVKCLKNTVNTNGVVFGAFEEERLVGFVSVENSFFGSEKQYLQLSCIHVSEESRGKGIGKQLFSYAVESARKLGAGKLYISAHSSKESQAFYHALGCIEAKEYNCELAEAEPCDCQLEFRL